MMSGNGELSVPPGFRFHPTDEELLYYYLRKKVSYESIDLDVIREVDLNKLEPWDLKDKCRIGSGPQNEWYFFSHKDKKYPTGTRTNRATTAGFWKATGRDKAIFHASSSNSNKRIGMRKTLVFYTGRAPHGQKTDWIMHEYRLDVELEHDHQHQHQHHHHNHNINNSHIHHQQEDGWVVCRVFKKKNQISRSASGFFPHQEDQDQEQEHYLSHINSAAAAPPLDHHHLMMNKQNLQMHPSLLHHQHIHHYNNNNNPNFDASMHLPHLFSPESAPSGPVPPSFNSNTSMDNIECSQNLLSLTSSGAAATASGLSSLQPSERLNADWSFLDKLLASHQTSQTKLANNSMGLGIGSLQLAAAAAAMGSNFNQKFTFPYLGEPDHIMKISK